MIRLSAGENLISENQQRVGDSHHRWRLLPPGLGGNSPELLLQEAVLLHRSGPGALGQSAAQPRVAARGLTALVFTCAPIVSRTDSRPGTEVFLRWKLRHILSGFRQNDRGTGLLHSRQALQ